MGGQMFLDQMAIGISWIRSALHLFMYAIFVSVVPRYLYVVIMPCILFMRHEHM
jgi:hypothetical protein